MFKVLFCLGLVFSFVRCQTSITNVRLIGHVDYIVKVIRNVVLEVEDREWCNLKVPEIRSEVNETILDDEYLGNVRYFNGFVTSIQHIDILQNSVQQVWRFNSTDRTDNTVALRGNLRFHDLTLGYDVEAVMTDGVHRYTAEFKHDLLTFAFDMVYNLYSDETTVSIIPATIPISRNVVDFLPKDGLSDVLTTLFQSAWTHEGVEAWNVTHFVPITHDVISTVEFPRICYDCPVTA